MRKAERWGHLKGEIDLKGTAGDYLPLITVLSL